MDSTGDDDQPAGGLAAAGAWVLRPGADIPDELGADFDAACAALGVEPREEGYGLWYLYGVSAETGNYVQLTAVVTLVRDTAAVMSMWGDDIIGGLPALTKSNQIVNMVEGWPGPMVPDPVFEARGPVQDRPEATIEHPPPDITNGEHHPTMRYGPGPWAVVCADCDWGQLVDDELLHNGAELLAAWHAAYPARAVNHLDAPPERRVVIPEYVTWHEHDGALVVIDQRAGLIYSRKPIALGVYKAAQGGRSLAASKPPVRAAIADLYRWGLLLPREADPPQPHPG